MVQQGSKETLKLLLKLERLLAEEREKASEGNVLKKQ